MDTKSRFIRNNKKIKVKGMETNVTDAQLDKEIFDVIFDGVMLQITRGKDGTHKVSNAVNGHGRNCYDMYKDEQVIITE